MLELMNNIVMYLRGIKYKGNSRTFYFLKVKIQILNNFESEKRVRMKGR